MKGIIVLLFLLFLVVCFTTLFATCYKIAAERQNNVNAVNLMMYASSLVLLGVYILVHRHFHFNLVAMSLGGLGGVFSFFATITFFYHMKSGQLSASWTVIALSLAIPVLASIFIWHEHPTNNQIAGFVLIIVALVLFGRRELQKTGDAQ